MDREQAIIQAQQYILRSQYKSLPNNKNEQETTHLTKRRIIEIQPGEEISTKFKPNETIDITYVLPPHRNHQNYNSECCCIIQ
jgi:hypothetical protein